MSAVMAKLIRLSAVNGKTNDANVMFARNVLMSGPNVVAIPTDTVYGLAVSALNESAIHALYQLKSRDSSNPIAICVSDVDQLSKWCQLTVGLDVLKDLLPGAVTLVFRRSSNLNKVLNPNHDLVGLRVPNHNFVRDLCRSCGPLALTSANLSGQSSCLSVDEFDHLWPKLSAVFDGGPIGQSDLLRLGSTVVDLSIDGSFRIVRNGCVLNPTLQTLECKYRLTRL